MPLNWNLSEIEGHESVCWTGPDDDARMSPVTEGLIFATLFVGIPKITKQNWREFAVRYQMTWDVHRFEGEPPTPAQIKAHIGLSTNASEISKVKFGGNVARAMRERAASKVSASE